MSVEVWTAATGDAHAAAGDDERSPPDDLQAAVRAHFRSGAAGGITGAIGCGSGCVVDWLNRNGYPCVGFDASAALLARAQARFPDWRFERSTLPSLEEIAPRTFDNVVCDGVLMHLPRDAVAAAVDGLRRVVVPDGVVYLRWSVGDTERRDGLIGAIDAALVRDALGDATILQSTETIATDVRIHAVVARMSGRRYNRKPARNTRTAGPS